ncbi:MAG: hypothetical protein ACI8V7_000666 [Candidatus Paceibacteria bacterium]|jgi:hypothetical protein
MKSLKCDFCESNIEGEDFESFMKEAHAHYGSVHADKLEAISDEDKAKWVEETKVKFEEA